MAFSMTAEKRGEDFRLIAVSNPIPVAMLFVSVLVTEFLYFYNILLRFHSSFVFPASSRQAHSIVRRINTESVEVQRD